MIISLLVIESLIFIFFDCEFKLEFDDNFTINIETNYFYNIESKKIRSYLLCCIDRLESRRYNFCNNNQMIINTISDKCNMTYEYYMNQPMIICERTKNLNKTKYPQLINSLGRNKNHTLIGDILTYHLITKKCI